MSKTAELRQKRSDLWDKAKAFLNEHADANGMMNAEDNATYERMEKDIDSYGVAIDREERAERLERELNAPTSKVLSSRPEKPVLDNPGRASDEYRDSFWCMVRDRFANYSVFNALQVGTDTEGGYLVPDEYERTLVQALQEENKLRSLCKVIHTSSGDRKIPLVAGRGSASWIDEEGAIPETDSSFGQISLGAHKIGAIIKVSEELLRDSVFDVEGYIATEFASLVGGAEEDAFINGDGAGKPIGLLHSSNGAATGVTAASATSFTADELIDLVYSLKAPYRRHAMFLFNDQTIKAVRKLKDGNGQFLWQAGLNGQPDTLLGYRYETSYHMPLIGAGAKPILFGDFSSYWIADREGRSIQRLNELYAATGQIGFRVTQRLDARLVQQEGMKCLAMKAGS